MARWLMTLVLLLWSIGRASADELQAGAAVIDITPPVGHPLWGYAARHDKPSDGILDPLRARALVLGVGSERIALVSLDLGRAPTRKSTAAIAAKIKQDAGIAYIFLVASHTHHGPVIELDNWPTARDSYVRQLESKLADVIIQAAKASKPARIGVACKETTLNRNRHSKRADKPVDRELLVLRVEDRQSKPIAHAVNFAAHPTMLPMKTMKLSADFPGAMAEAVEKETGVPCLFLQGAAGDLSPNTGGEGSTQFGQTLGKQVLQMIGGIRCADTDQSTLRIREEEFQFKSRIDLGNVVLHAAMSAAFFPQLIDFYVKEYRDGVRPRLTVALLNGTIGFVGVSGEFFCSQSLQLKRRARLEHLFFLGYCNDYQQYFPTIEAISEGGYGTDPTISPVEFGAGEKIMDRALVHLYQMRGKLLEVK